MAGRVSAYPAVQSFRLILLCGLQDDVYWHGAPGADRVVTCSLSIPLADGFEGRLTDGLTELLADCLTA